MTREIFIGKETLIFAGTNCSDFELNNITAVLIWWRKDHHEFISRTNPQKRLTRLGKTIDPENLLISYKDEQNHDNVILAPSGRSFLFGRIPGTGLYPVPKYIDQPEQ